MAGATDARDVARLYASPGSPMTHAWLRAGGPQRSRSLTPTTTGDGICSSGRCHRLCSASPTRCGWSASPPLRGVRPPSSRSQPALAEEMALHLDIDAAEGGTLDGTVAPDPSLPDARSAAHRGGHAGRRAAATGIDGIERGDLAALPLGRPSMTGGARQGASAVQMRISAGGVGPWPPGSLPCAGARRG